MLQIEILLFLQEIFFTLQNALYNEMYLYHTQYPYVECSQKILTDKINMYSKVNIQGYNPRTVSFRRLASIVGSL